MYLYFEVNVLEKEFFYLSDRIRMLRERSGIKQAELAKTLGISRSGVNSWEMGLSVPSTRFIVELSKIFGVSTDYLLGVERNSVISVEGLSDKQVQTLLDIIDCFKGV